MLQKKLTRLIIQQAIELVYQYHQLALKIHFYMRMVPKYEKNYGSLGIKSVLGKSFAPEVAEDAKKLFQVTNDNIIIAEKSKIVAKLHIEIGNTTIPTKNHLPNDINAVDQET
jgi:hypothetical protein